MLLLLFFILPGILYMLFGSQTYTVPFAVTIATSGEGTVVIPSRTGQGFWLAANVVAALPVVSG